MVAAVAPAETVEIGGWLIPLDPGTIGRAKSAVPLSHEPDLSAIGDIIRLYRSRGLPPAFRLADVAALEPVRDALARQGFAGRQPTVMKIGDVADLAAFSDRPARLLAAPDDAWKAVFAGAGFDPADGAARIANLSRSPGAMYGAAGQGGIQAVGVATVAHGLAGVHGMRTSPDHRGQGLAPAILGTFGRALAAQGLSTVVLQVEEPNPARRIYRRAGFEPAWIFRYWKPE